MVRLFCRLIKVVFWTFFSELLKDVFIVIIDDGSDFDLWGRLRAGNKSSANEPGRTQQSAQRVEEGRLEHPPVGAVDRD